MVRMALKMKMTTMKSSPRTMPATGLIHKNESGPVNPVIFATTQLSADYLIIMSNAAKATILERERERERELSSPSVRTTLLPSCSYFGFEHFRHYSVKETVMGA